MLEAKRFPSFTVIVRFKLKRTPSDSKIMMLHEQLAPGPMSHLQKAFSFFSFSQPPYLICTRPVTEAPAERPSLRHCRSVWQLMLRFLNEYKQ